MPLLIQPALGRLVTPLQHHVVALQPARQVVPSRRDEGVLALEGLYSLVRRGLGFLSMVLSRCAGGLKVHIGTVKGGRVERVDKGSREIMAPGVSMFGDKGQEPL